MTDFKKVLDEAGCDPQRIMHDREHLIRTVHETTFDAVAEIINNTMDFCRDRGIGEAGRLYALGGASEAALYAMAVVCTYPPDLMKVTGKKLPLDSVLFAALLTACCATETESGPSNLHAAHLMFEKITGRGFRDCFIDNCSCKHCKARRQRHGIKINLDRAGIGL